MTSLVQTRKVKSLLKVRELRPINEWILDKVKEFSYLLYSMKLKQRTRRYFTKILVSLDCKSLPTSNNKLFITKTCRLIMPLKRFITVMLKLENVMRTSGVPYHLLLYECVTRIQHHIMVYQRTTLQT